MKHYLLLALTSLACITANAQSPTFVKQSPYFVKTTGEKVTLYPNDRDQLFISMTNAKFSYHNEKGKEITLHQSEVQDVYLSDIYLTLLPITKGMDRLLDVIATNDKYILSVYHTTYGNGANAQYLYVHDKATKEILEGRRGSIKFFNVSVDYDDIFKVINKYFPDCSELIKQVNANLTVQKEAKKIDRDGPFFFINNIKCK